MLGGGKSAGRVFERLEHLYAIGAGPGANRVGYTVGEDEAHDLAAGWMEQAGLDVSIDAAGNLYGRVLGSDPGTGEVWAGSHLDTVPQGGRFDGALGVVVAIEAVERIGRQAGTLAAVAFRDEERGCTGSRALAACGPLPRAYLELHIEQGPRLERAGIPLAVVTGIVAYARGELVLEGRSAHAGTTPMDARDDALCAAAEVILRIRDAARAVPGAVATVGQVEVEPGAANVIPGRARLSMDVRGFDRETVERLVAEIGFEPALVHDAVEMSDACRAALGEEIAARGLPLLELPSGAGHDAGILAAAGVEAGMLFVRSLNGGVSHSPDEVSSGEDVALAVDVLAGALGRLSA